MTEWTTIRVRKDAKEQAEARKPDSVTWSEFLASEEYDPAVNVDLLADELATRLREEPIVVSRSGNSADQEGST